jgi:hypothetical protein
MLAAIRVISIVGLVLFGPVFLATALAPTVVEQAAKSYVKAKAKSEADRYLESFAGRTLAKTYDALRDRYAQQLADNQAALEADLPGIITELMDRLCHFDCGAKAELKIAITEGMKAAAVALKRGLDKIKALAQEKYSETVAKIRRDLMIFSGCNVVIFALLLGLTLLRRQHARPLTLPAALMVIATAASAAIYLFGQDWFWVVLTDSYMGFGYLGYVAVIFLFLMDIVYNGAQVTQGIMNAITEALSKCLPA